MKLEIEIDEAYIAELVSKEIARRIVETHGYENREAKYGIRDGVDKAIRQYIYSKNEGAQRAFSYMAKTALNNFNLDEIDHEDIVGCYIKAVVEHEKVPSNKDPAKTVTFVNLSNYSPASSFETAEKDTPTTKKTESKSNPVDLDALLG